jgi:hypothetical protein
MPQLAQIGKKPTFRLVKDDVTVDQLKEKLGKHHEIILHKVKVPSIRTLEKYAWDGIAKTPVCGCRVEPDGYCPHGRPSWLILLFLI